jgi:hypothetical protein
MPAPISDNQRTPAAVNSILEVPDFMSCGRADWKWKEAVERTGVVPFNVQWLGQK